MLKIARSIKMDFASLVIGFIILMTNYNRLLAESYSVVTDKQSNFGFGPVEISDQMPISLLHSSLRPSSPKPLAINKLNLSLSSAWTNTFLEREDRYILDAETLLLEPALHYGISESLEVGFRVPFIWRGGGQLDRPIDGYHQTLSLPRGSRDKVSDNNFELAGYTTDGERFEIEEQGFELADPELQTKYLLTPGDRSSPSLATLLSLKLPLASHNSYGQDGIDLTLAFLSSKRLSPKLSTEKEELSLLSDLVLYGGIGYLYYTSPKHQSLSFERHHYEGFISLEYEYSEQTSLLMTLVARSRVVSNIIGYDKYATYLDLAITTKLTQQTALTLLLRENPAPRDSTADVTFLFGVQVYSQ